MDRKLLFQVVIVAVGSLAGAFALAQARKSSLGRDLFGRG